MTESNGRTGDATTLRIDRSTFFWAYWSLLAAVMVGYIWNARPSMSPNDNARWDTIWSLVEDGTYEIDDEKRQLPTIDKVVRARDGKVISSKPPLLPTVMAGFVKLLQWIVGEPFTKDLPIPGKPLVPGSINIYAKAVLLAFNVAPVLLTLWLFRRFLDRVAQTQFAWIYSLLVFGLGTLVTGYVVTLNNHVVAATWGFVAAYNVIRIVYDGQRQWWRFALVGLLAGWTAANELPAALFVIVVGLILLAIDARKTLAAFAAPLVLVTAAFFYTNLLAVGDPSEPFNTAKWKSNYLPAYLQKDLYQTDIGGKESYWKTGNPNRSPIDALNDNPEPKWLYFVHSTVGHHGLVSLSPVLLFCFWGWWVNVTGRHARMTGYALALALVTAVVLSFYLFITDQRNYGGFCHGLRWMIWLTPMWLLLLPSGLDDLRGRRWLPYAAWAALLVSTISVFDTWYNPWTRAWLHRVFLYFGIVDY